jgi:hypothetical protein
MNLPKIITTIKDATQVVAVLIGGYWTYRLFVKQRLGYERVDVSQDVDCWPLSSHLRLVRVAVTIKNVGTVVHKPQRLMITLSRVVPAEVDLVEKAENGGVPYAAHPVHSNWTELRSFTHDMSVDEFSLEPAETERYPFDFTIPGYVQVVQVHSELWSGTGRDEQYWDETTLHTTSRQSPNEGVEKP